MQNMRRSEQTLSWQTRRRDESYSTPPWQTKLRRMRNSSKACTLGIILEILVLEDY
jgi:hypothetical protein